jgi:protocatechuate 3,4-dioxygenase beta subunit
MRAIRSVLLQNVKLRIPLAIVLLCASASFARTQSQDQSTTPASTTDKSNAQTQSNNSDKPPAQTKNDKSKKSDDPPTTKLRIHVTDSNDKPVGNASIYVRFNEPGGMFHHDKLSEMNFKTNQDGSVKVPDVPQGKVLIQVVAKGLHTYGKWFEIDKDEESVEIKLEPAPHWY